MASIPRFVVGEKALCFQGPLLYEAKCLESKIGVKGMQYFIHYNGWNKKWDEWVPECRVLKYNETNLQKKKELAKTIMKTQMTKSAPKAVKKETEKQPVQTTASEKRRIKSKPVKIVSAAVKTEPLEEQVQTSSSAASSAASAASSAASAASSAASAASKKSILRKTEKKGSVPSSSTEQSAENQPERKKKKVNFAEPCFIEEAKEVVEIKLNFPDLLKCWLVDDWDLITRQQMILSLPARVTVDHVIAGFVKEKVSVKGISKQMENTIVQVANQIRELFNVLLGKELLYKFERPQYVEIYAEYRERGMSQAYGVIHLLRMFTKLGPLLTPIVEKEKSSPLVEHLNAFLKYISMNRNFFTVLDYGVATPEYLRRAL